MGQNEHGNQARKIASVIEASEFTLPEALFKTIDHFTPGF